MMGDNNYNNSMSSFYRSKLNKTPEDMQAPDPLEAASKASQFDIDFSKPSFQEQIPQQDMAKIGGETLKTTPAQQTAQAPSDTEQVVDKGSDALIMFGDPSMKAVGLGLKAAQGINNAQRQRKMDRYNAEVAKIQARQDAINKLAQIGQGLKA